MKTYEITDIPKIISEGGYKYCALYSQAGNKIIPYNSNRIDVQDRCKEIIRRIEKGGLPDGYYCIKCKTSYSANATADNFYIYNGVFEDQVIEPTATIIEEKEVSPNVLTYESALKLNVELASLKLENKNLKNQIEKLEFELSECNDMETLEDGPKTSMEHLKDMAENLISIGAPIMDKYFQNKQMELQLKAQSIQIPGQMPGNFQGFNTQANPETKQTNQKFESYLSPQLEEFIFSPEHNEENSQMLEALFYNSEDDQDFLTKLNDNNPGLCNQCKAVVYGSE